MYELNVVQVRTLQEARSLQNTHKVWQEISEQEV